MFGVKFLLRAAENSSNLNQSVATSFYFQFHGRKSLFTCESRSKTTHNPERIFVDLRYFQVVVKDH